MKGFYVSASGAIQGHHGPLVTIALMFFAYDNKEILILQSWEML